MTVYNVSAVVDATFEVGTVDRAVEALRALLVGYDVDDAKAFPASQESFIYYASGMIAGLFEADSSFEAIQKMRNAMPRGVSLKGPMAFESEDVPQEWVR